MMNLTFFTIPKAFVGHWKIAQYNAIRSWGCLEPNKIMLFSQDKGVKGAAKELGCVQRNVQLHKTFRLPIIQNAFDVAQREATTRLMCFINTDIILMDDFKAAVELIANRFDQFLMIGRRWGWTIREPLDFSTDWQCQLWKRARTAKLYGRAGLDVFVFNRGLYRQGQVTRALIGRRGWDLWMSSHIMRRRKIPVIDATKAVMWIHQNPPPGQHTPKRRDQVAYNDRVIGDVSNAHAGYATWELTEEMKLIKRKKLPGPKWLPRKNGKFWEVRTG